MFSFVKFVTVMAIIKSINAALPKFRHLREISPEDIGLYHTESFERLAELYTTKTPEHKDSAKKDLIDIVSSYCANQECIESTLNTASEDISVGLRNIHAEFPDSIVPSVREYLELMRSSVKLIDVENHEEVIQMLASIQSKLREDDSISEEDKFLGLAAGSVAIESSKLWVSVFKDPQHPLRAIKRANSQDRNLQVEVVVDVDPPEDLWQVILADVIGLILTLGIPVGAVLASYFAYEFVTVEVVQSSPTPAPTPEPAVIETRRPTPDPTNAPSSVPSSSPLPSASPLPSLTPSASPLPSLTPSASPLPSLTPSLAPTGMPV